MTQTHWQLDSSSGDESVRWDVREERPGRDGKTLVCDVFLSGRYFGAELRSPTSGGPDFSLVLGGLEIGTVELDRLAAYIREWLQLQPIEQINHPPAFECSVGALHDQSLILSLGPRDDIASDGKPVATFRYIVGRLTGEFVFVTDQTCLRRLVEGIERKSVMKPPVAVTQTGDATGGLIPYKNPAALIAYYCGIFSLVPFLGLAPAVAGIVLGVIGLRRRKATPVIMGALHAWVGIVLGSLMTIVWGTAIALIFVAIVS